MNHAHLFAFEADFVASLRCIPMAVRLKLDRAEIKLSLRQWSRFTKIDRRRLLETRCETRQEITEFRSLLLALIRLRSGDVAKVLADPPKPLWEDVSAIPQAVSDYAAARSISPPTVQDWADLHALQRFALLKLSRDNHDNENFLPAMAEFGLLRDDVVLNKTWTPFDDASV